VPKLNKKRLASTVSRAARVILGAMLLLAILAAHIPSSAVAIGSMCTLACCAGRAPHAAGSCMNGSCHAFLKGRAQTSKIHLQLPVYESEHLCGLPRSSTRNSVMSLRGSRALTLAASSERTRGSHAPDAASVYMSTIGKPCEPECGTGTFSSSSQSRQRDSSAISYADKPRPPTATRLAYSPFNVAKTLDALCRRSRPRGPPLTSS